MNTRTIKYYDKETNKYYTMIIVAKKLSTAKAEAKNMVMHHPNISIISVY